MDKLNSEYKILVVDDEEDLCEIIQFNLAAEGYQVTTANSAEEALKGDLSVYDLLLLDVMMDGLSGFEMAEQLKAEASTASIPIIFLTAKDTEEDLLKGFQVGADDYISKPFSVRELKARVHALLKRTHEQSHPKATHTLHFNGLELNLDAKTMSLDGKDVPITKTEFELLQLFLAHKGHIFSRNELMQRIWKSNHSIVLDRTIDVNITRLRKKIGHLAKHIVTRIGYGYYFES